MSGAVCLANGPVELCDREEFTTGSYQHQLNTPIRVMESDLRATTASLPQNVGLTPTDVMELVSEQTPRLVELLEAAVATVDSLTPPDEFQADHDRLSSYRRSSIANATAGGAAAEAGYGAAFEAAQSAFGIARCAAFDGLETGEFFEFKGEHFEIQSIKMSPAPTKRIPILIGGHAEPALRRAARTGDGWMHAGGDAKTLNTLLGRLGELRAEYGRENDPFEIHVISMDAYTLDGVKRLEDMGITDAIVGFRNAYEPDTTTLDHKIGSLRGFAENVIAKL